MEILKVDQVYELISTKPGSPTPEVVGYGIATPGVAGTKDADQVQRWFFEAPSVEVLRSKISPARSVVWRPATTAPWSTMTSTGDFLTHIQTSGVFQPGVNLYAKVNCLELTGYASIPRPIPVPALLEKNPNGGSQIGVGTSQVGRDAGGYTGPTGYVHAFFDTDLTSTEYWVLFPGYTTPTASFPNRIDTVRKAEDFASFFDASPWNTSCTMVVARCGYYTKLPTNQPGDPL